jgi:beta-N-acetylhexosaminidase
LIGLITAMQFMLGSTAASGQVIDSASSVLNSMTPEERIGQIFLITFQGSQVQDNPEIRELIEEHHISGVILSANADNFVDSPETIPAAVDLIRDLQNIEYEGSFSGSLEDDEGNPKNPAYVPLFIGLKQDGDGAPFSEIHSGISKLPSQMSIGATWDPNYAEEVGQVLGKELEALGVNLLLGPSLDVLEDPRLVGQGDIGVRSFGGDPYWVSLMGQAYIRGVHQGSEGRVGVIAKHFPGLGGTDRPYEEEIATIRKSLSQLQQIDLVPFLQVAENPPGDGDEIADGFLTSNIRFQGFQGNIRATTRPVSLDRDAYDQLMALEGIENWREGGGITVSDSLGSRAIRRFIESLGQTYKGHIVTKDAFLAGNDLLYLDDIRSESDPDEITTIKATLAFFAQKYREDPVFAQRVDEAVLRILKLKIRIYEGIFELEQVLPEQSRQDLIGQEEQLAIEVARAGASLVSPFKAEVEDGLGETPKIQERVVFFSDTRYSKQCSTCVDIAGIERDALENAVLRLYGPRAAAQVGGWNLSSYTMADLANYLGTSPPIGSTITVIAPEEMDEDIITADWLIFSTLRSTNEHYGSNALKQLLDERQDLVVDKRIVVFSHDVPYVLDATDISKIDLFYTLYAKSAPFIDHAARLLFQEVPAVGSPPVSVPGIGYDLIRATSPDPEQLIGLQINRSNQETQPAGEEPESYSIGEVISVETSKILDTNSNQVPDGTPVEFLINYQAESLQTSKLSSVTLAGVARATMTLDKPGTISIRVESAPARDSEVLQINVVGEPEDSGTIEPATETPAAATLESEKVPSPTASPEVVEERQEEAGDERPSRLGYIDFLLGMAGVIGMGGMGWAAEGYWGRGIQKTKYLLLGMIGGLVGYNYFAFGLPGSEQMFSAIGHGAAMVIALVGGGVSLGAAFLNREVASGKGRKKRDEK